MLKHSVNAMQTRRHICFVEIRLRAAQTYHLRPSYSQYIAEPASFSIKTSCSWDADPLLPLFRQNICASRQLSSPATYLQIVAGRQSQIQAIKPENLPSDLRNLPSWLTKQGIFIACCSPATPSRSVKSHLLN